MAKNVGIVTGVFLFGKYALGPMLALVHKSESKEIFIGTCLTVIIGSSLLMEEAGLSKALGAFIAGIFLSDSNLKREIQDFSVTLKSMLMGVFFMGIGLDFDLKFFNANIVNVLTITATFISLKFLILLGIGRLSQGSWVSGAKVGAVLAQGGEFGFLLLGMSASSVFFTEFQMSLVFTSITLSIFLAPFITKLFEGISVPHKALELEQTAKEQKSEDGKILDFPKNVDSASNEKKFGT
jgi:Kef-type K+ transport system membrane component KefB